MPAKIYYASPCLCGVKCRYDGQAKTDPSLSERIDVLFKADGKLLCPEVLGGLPVPREPAEIVGGTGDDVLDGKAKVMTQNGQDVTIAFVQGAQAVLDVCLAKGVTDAYLRIKSPSCGLGDMYDGTFSGRLVPGNGVFAALLIRHGINVHPV